MGLWCSGWAYDVVVSMFVFHSGDCGSNPARAVKFDIAILYIKVPLGSNGLFVCPLDVNLCPVQ